MVRSNRSWPIDMLDTTASLENHHVLNTVGKKHEICGLQKICEKFMVKFRPPNFGQLWWYEAIYEYEPSYEFLPNIWG